MGLFQADESKKWYKHCLRVKDSDAIRIKMALVLPAVFESVEDMKTRWSGMLSSVKKLLERPRLTLERDAWVLTRSYDLMYGGS